MNNKHFRSVFLLIGCISILSFLPLSSSAKIAAPESNSVSTILGESCRVTKRNGSKFFVESTRKDIILKKGTLLNVVSPQMQQGLIVVRAKQGKKWVRGEILAEDTSCAPKL